MWVFSFITLLYQLPCVFEIHSSPWLLNIPTFNQNMSMTHISRIYDIIYAFSRLNLNNPIRKYFVTYSQIYVKKNHIYLLLFFSSIFFYWIMKCFERTHAHMENVFKFYHPQTNPHMNQNESQRR